MKQDLLIIIRLLREHLRQNNLIFHSQKFDLNVNQKNQVTANTKYK